MPTRAHIVIHIIAVTDVVTAVIVVIIAAALCATAPLTVAVGHEGHGPADRSSALGCEGQWEKRQVRFPCETGALHGGW